MIGPSMRGIPLPWRGWERGGNKGGAAASAGEPAALPRKAKIRGPPAPARSPIV